MKIVYSSGFKRRRMRTLAEFASKVIEKTRLILMTSPLSARHAERSVLQTRTTANQSSIAFTSIYRVMGVNEEARQFEEVSESQRRRSENRSLTEKSWVSLDELGV